jgi:hypothetical protein
VQYHHREGLVQKDGFSTILPMTGRCKKQPNTSWT